MDDEEIEIEKTATVSGAKRDRRAYSKAYYERNKTKILKRASEYQKENRDKRRTYHKEWRDRNRGKWVTYSRKAASKRREADPEKDLEYRRKSSKEWRRKNPFDRYIADTKNWLKASYDLTLDEWHKMLIDQSGCCGLCHKPFEDSKWMSPAVDHNHDTNKVRELVHSKCNTGLGMFNDSLIMCENAAVYLRRHGVTV